MPKKPAVKKKKDQKIRKRLSLTRLLIIILAAVIVIALILVGIYSPKQNNSTLKPSSNLSKTTSSFRKDGDLSIISANDSIPIKIEIEIVDEEEERMRGLMDRHNLPEMAGMLFIFPNEEPRSFWMKNTYISLDIIYINSKKEIVSIQKYTQPRSTYSIPSEKPAMYVLEVNAGFTDKYGINPGDRIETDGFSRRITSK